MNHKLPCCLLTCLILAMAFPASAHEDETLFNVFNLQDYVSSSG